MTFLNASLLRWIGLITGPRMLEPPKGEEEPRG